MSVAGLDSALLSAAARRSAFATPASKAANPYEFDNGGFQADDQTAENQDQFRHYSGTFYSAARIIVSRFSEQPFMLARRTRRPAARSVANAVRNGFIPHGTVPNWIGATDRLELLDAHVMKRAMSDPNEVMTEYNMREMLGGSILATGRAYLVALDSSREGRALDLWPVPSTWMQRPEKNSQTWRIKPPGSMAQGIPVHNRQVSQCYFADPSNPAHAISPLAMAARAVLVNEAIHGSQLAEFRNGPMPKVALIAGDVMNESSFTDSPDRSSAARPVELKPFQRRQIVTWYQQQYANVQKHGLPMVLDAVIRDIKVLSRKPEEMAFLESSDMTKQQIHAVLAVSKLLMGELEGVSRASGALAEQFFVDYSLNPLISLASQAITKMLCPLFALAGEELVGWVAPVVPRDVELQVELLKIGRLTYSLQRNEVRAIISRLTGYRLPYVEGWDDVVMPQTLDERDSDNDLVAIGRLGMNGDGASAGDGNARGLLLPAGANGQR